MTDPHHLEAGLDPSTAKTSLRRRTYRIGGLVAATSAVKAVACLVAAFYFFGGALLFCVTALGFGLVLIEFAAGGATFPNPNAKMWTLAQFETFGALRLDTYVRFLVTKLAVVWRTIAAIHKSAVNYSFTVSIAETPSIIELENLLEGHIPLLTYEGVTTEDEWIRSRGTSLASSICDEESTSTSSEPLTEEVFYSIDMETVELDNPDDCVAQVEEEPPTVDEAELKQLETQVKATVTALKSVVIPLVPLAQLASSYCKLASSNASEGVSLEPLLEPSIKPLIHEAPITRWVAPMPAPAAPVKTASLPQHKRRISVTVATCKPTPRVVVKPKPSTLTPSQSVQRMLEQADSVLRELNALLAAGNELLYPSELETECTPRKSVHFSDEVSLIEASTILSADDENVDSSAASLFYGSDEIESMTAEFFASSSLEACY